MWRDNNVGGDWFVLIGIWRNLLVNRFTRSLMVILSWASLLTVNNYI